MTPLDILHIIRTRIATGYTQGAWARDAAGEWCHPGVRWAVAWSLGGACSDRAFPYITPMRSIVAARVAIADAIGLEMSDDFTPWDVVKRWSEVAGRTQGEVMAAVDAAIEGVQR